MKKLSITLFSLVIVFIILVVANPTNENAKNYFRTNTPYKAIFKGVSFLSGESDVVNITMCRDNYYIFSRYYLKVEALYVAQVQVYYGTGFLGKLHVRKDFRDGSYPEKIFNGAYEKETRTHDECSKIY